MYIFGGDRHLMSFNDLYTFELENGIQSLELYRTKWNTNDNLSNKKQYLFNSLIDKYVIKNSLNMYIYLYKIN